MPENKALSVTEVTNIIKNLIDGSPFLSSIIVEGEISNYKRNASGHIYFTLKDMNSAISCVMFRSSAQSLTFEPKEGSKVYVKGTVSVYEKTGVYQIYVSKMKEQGLGDLYQKYLELKDKLEKKGYFDQSIKKPLPPYPKCIALLTSKTGAVIEDLKSIILKRSQFSDLILYPTKVQGEDAKYNIAENIRKADQNPKVDVIILARGGGSIEDLWPFNEEIVADAIHECSKPIISAVGHETDFTISDFTADLRAATPSDAALIVVKDRRDLKNTLDQLTLRLNLSFANNLDYIKSKLQKLLEREVIKNKERIFLTYRQELLNLTNKLDLLSPKSLLEKRKVELDSMHKHMNLSYEKIVRNLERSHLVLNEKLKLLNPLSVMDKGYSITFIGDKAVRSISEVNIGDMIETKLKDGSIISEIKEKK